MQYTTTTYTYLTPTQTLHFQSYLNFTNNRFLNHAFKNKPFSRQESAILYGYSRPLS